MTRKTKHALLIGGGALALILATAGASAYVAQRAMVEPDKAKSQKEEIVWDDPKAQAPQPEQQAASSCDDANVVGAAIGAVAGGVAGNQIGSGRGQDLATVGGAIGGGVLGQQYIPTRNVLCP